MFHRVDDPARLPAARYFGFALYLAAYDGAVRRRMQHEAVERRRDEPEGQVVPEHVALAIANDWIGQE